MKIETQISIGDIVLLFGDPNYRTVCTAITIRASGQIEYEIEWSQDGELKNEWITAERLECLSKIYKNGNPELNYENKTEAIARRADGTRP